MWIWIANKFATFHTNRRNQVKIFLKVLGGYFFETPCIVHEMMTFFITVDNHARALLTQSFLQFAQWRISHWLLDVDSRA